ncbi:MAG TPA: sterol desaturase family protein [Myxococcales bacterium]|nr:sterol desaturase family protein [Myxococcales bacterium]
MLHEVAYRVFFYFSLAAPFVILEARAPARDVPYRKVILRDLAAYVLVVAISLAVGFALFKVYLLLPMDSVFRRAPRLRSWQILPICLVGNDLLLYWLHRAMHTTAGWRAHRWHHSPKQMYWLAGARASAVHQALFMVPALLPIVLKAPGNVYLVTGLWATLTNHWMHTNFVFRARWLEWLVITPRAHHIHHSDDPAHFGKNLGSFSSIWDRLFGTWLDPDTLEKPVTFGIPDQVHPARVYLGV